MLKNQILSEVLLFDDLNIDLLHSDISEISERFLEKFSELIEQKIILKG